MKSTRDEHERERGLYLSEPAELPGDSFRALHCKYCPSLAAISNFPSPFASPLLPALSSCIRGRQTGTESVETSQVSPGLEFGAARSDQNGLALTRCIAAASVWLSPDSRLTRSRHSCCQRRVAA